MLRERPLRLSAGFFDRFIGIAEDDRVFDEKESLGFASLFADLLAAALPGLATQDASKIVDRFVRAAYGPWTNEHELPDRLLDLMLETRAYTSLVSMFGWGLQFGLARSKRLAGYLDRVRDAAAASPDPVLAACHALVADPEQFEQLAAGLPLNESTATLVGWSTTRYPEAASWLLQVGRFDEAEEVCRTNHDLRMAGAVLERAGDPRRAARVYAQARHYSEAIRLYRKLGDQRAVERMRKKMKEAPPVRKPAQPGSRQPLLPGLEDDSAPAEAPKEKPHEPD
jgi:tetratricopeptide (TPR) repeat protein